MLRRLLLCFRRLLQAFWNLLKRPDPEIPESRPSFAPEVTEAKPPFDSEILIFFNLPDVALKQVFSYLDAGYIFHLSLLIPELTPMLQHAKTINPLIDIRENCFSMTLHSSTETHMSAEEISVAVRNNGYLFSIKKGTARLSNREKHVKHVEFLLPALSLELLLCQLINLFHFNHLNISSPQEKADVFLPALINTKSKIQWLTIMRDHQPESFKLPVSHLQSLLEDVKCDKLDLEWDFVLEEEKYFGKLKQKKQIYIRTASWLSIDSLLTMECAVFDGYHVKLTASEIKMFIKKWMDGGLKQLEQLELRGDLWRSWITVLDGLDPFEGKVTELPMELNSMENLKEIRSNDGKKKAVVGLEYYHFAMKVL